MPCATLPATLALREAYLGLVPGPPLDLVPGPLGLVLEPALRLVPRPALGLVPRPLLGSSVAREPPMKRLRLPPHPRRSITVIDQRPEDNGKVRVVWRVAGSIVEYFPILY